MTREEAIRLIGWLKCTTNREDDLEAIDMAIEALQTLEAVERIKTEVLPQTEVYEDYEHATLVDIKEPLKVSVVRCKDCRYGEHIQIHLWGNREIDNAPSSFHDFIKCHKYNIKGFNETLYLNDDDFCSHGERRKGNRK